jgi:hypothetical protein
LTVLRLAQTQSPDRSAGPRCGLSNGLAANLAGINAVTDALVAQ